MNISEAKDQVKKSVIIYLEGEIPKEQQRPLMLFGPPGVGKSAIVKQIAEELEIGYVAYSMTHHTRQSALGLPMIVQKDFGGTVYNYSEYTMSEILASVYEEIENTGNKKGILFLDEINCVSETLAPSMLQFLQFKTFGRHILPDGWVIVTAGNPPEYNNSVKDFDPVTMDRLRVLMLDYDYSAFITYAYDNLHKAILSFLTNDPKMLSIQKNDESGFHIITPRSWSDLSLILRKYEERGYPIDRNLTDQFLPDQEVSQKFVDFYDMFHKIGITFDAEEILSSKTWPEVFCRKRVDEKIVILHLLIDYVTQLMETTATYERAREAFYDACLKVMNYTERGLSLDEAKSVVTKSAVEEICDDNRRIMPEEFFAVLEDESVHKKGDRMKDKVAEIVAENIQSLEIDVHDDNVNSVLSNAFENFNANLMNYVSETREKYETLFCFTETVLSDQLVPVLINESNMNRTISDFIQKYGCEAYEKASLDFSFYERRSEITRAIEEYEDDWGVEGDEVQRTLIMPKYTS